MEDEEGTGLGNVSLRLRPGGAEDAIEDGGQRPSSVRRFHRLSEEKAEEEDFVEGENNVGGAGEDNVDEDDSPIVPHVMSEQEIMHKHWRLVVSYFYIKDKNIAFFPYNFTLKKFPQSSCKLTSLAFQRWMCVVTVTVLFW